MAYCVLSHELLDDSRVKPGVNMASKDGCRDVEATADFPLGQAVHILRKIVSKAPTLALILREIRGRYNGKVQEEGRDQRRN
jgi:hypothetical protein